MYCGNSILALRAKGPYYHHCRHHQCFSSDRAAERCGGCCSLVTGRPPCASAIGLFDRSFFTSSRFLYGYWVKQSALIRLTPSRIIFSCGDKPSLATRYRRLTAAWDRDIHKGGDWGRWSRRCSRHVTYRSGAEDAIFQDMLGPLAEGEESSWEDDCVAEEETSESAAASSSISGDLRSREVYKRRVVDKCSNSYDRCDSSSRRGVQETRKWDADSHSRRKYGATDRIVALNKETKMKEMRIRDEMDDTHSQEGFLRHPEERDMQKENQYAGCKELREGLQKISKISHINQSSYMEKNIVDKKMNDGVKKETSAADLLNVVRRQQDEMVQLRKDYLILLKATQVNNICDTKTTVSSSVSNTRVENFGETYTMPAGLLEEVQRQREEIGRLSENYKRLMSGCKMQESGDVRDFNSRKQSGARMMGREECSTSVINLIEEGRMQYCNVDRHMIDDSKTASQRLNGMNEVKEYNQEASDDHENVIQRSSICKKGQSMVLEDRRKEITSNINLVGEVHGGQTSVTQDQWKTRTSFQKLTGNADVHSNKPQTASGSRTHDVSKVDQQQESTSSSVKLIEEREQQGGDMKRKVTEYICSRSDSKEVTDTTVIHKNNMLRASTTQNHAKAIVKNKEESFTSAQTSTNLRRDQKNQIDHQAIEEVNVPKDVQSHINVSKAFKHDTDNEGFKLDECGKNAVIALNLEVQFPKNEYAKQPEQHFKLTNDSQRSPELFMGGQIVSDSEISKTGVKKGDDQSSSVKESKEKQNNNLVEKTFGSTVGTSESWHNSGNIQTHEFDVLESARRLDKSSSHYIGDFVGQLQKTLSETEDIGAPSYSSLETQMAMSRSSTQKSTTAVENKDQVSIKEGTLKHSSRVDAAGPSDEIWDMKGASPQGPSPMEGSQIGPSVRISGKENASTPTSSTGAIVKKNSKSLWSYIAEVVRTGWRTHTNSKNSLNSGTKSSNDSVDSDDWHSGVEPENVSEKNVQTVTKESDPKETAASKSHSRTSSSLSQVTSVASQGGITLQDITVPTETSIGAYASNISLSAHGSEELVPIDHGKGIEFLPSVVTAACQSALAEGVSVSTPAGKTETDKVSVSEVSFTKSQEEQETERVPGIVEIEHKEVELKQRKLQRKKQVLREEFEEWEEAYKLESEQRKIDEFFMKEALLEARKGGDMWEVPVGAVLVQDGKVIARACNLVEDLRDSTAHAEMICIREASNLLRTWRLAGTTLYVTLEPCPMCAGAILQSRIDVVVWGAPNKLLGADGSWVRLFPGGANEGKHGLDVPDQAAGPVHPFHPQITVRRGVLAMECADAMQQFFRRRRKQSAPEPPPPCLPASYPAKLLTKMHSVFGMFACM